jgi:hypothetical protein
MSLSTFAIAPPEPSEYDPYYGRYITLVERGDILRAMEQQLSETAALLSQLTEQQGAYRYAPDKWSVKEMLGHLIDTERILTYRALRIARGDKTPIEGFEQDDYVPYGRFDERTLATLVEEFASVRQSSLFLFKYLDTEAWMRRGIANRKEISVRALAYVIAGHELHHRRMIKDKYLTAAAG